jgi:hypothetical protein
MALGLGAGAASAAPVSSISWTVTGGNFNGPASFGPIAGGSVVYTPAGGSISTPAFSVNPAGSLAIKLTGMSGIFAATINTPLSGVTISSKAVYITPLFWDYTLNPLPTNYSGMYSLTRAAARVFALLGSGTGSVFGNAFATTTMGTAAYFMHNFTIGNEVKTIIPEPATGSLLGLGLLTLGVIGTRGRGAAARRRPRIRA